jgi:hypothetical protein
MIPVQQPAINDLPATIKPERLPIRRIDVTDEDIPEAAAQAWAALRAANGDDKPPPFVRLGNLACLRTADGLEALTPATLTYWLARTAIFFRILKSGERLVKPPRWLVNDMLAERMPDSPEEIPV